MSPGWTLESFGAGEGIRTLDPDLGKVKGPSAGKPGTKFPWRLVLRLLAHHFLAVQYH
jgi:hypothetical protein